MTAVPNDESTASETTGDAAPKVDPEDLTLRAKPRPVSRINRRVLYLLSGTGLLLPSAMNLRRTVALNLKRLRRDKDMSQEELADRAEINRNYVGMIERSENAASIDMLEKLADALDVKPIEFFQGD